MRRHLALVKGAEVGEAGFGCGICVFLLIDLGFRRVVFGDLGECGAPLTGAAIGCVFPERAFFGRRDDLAAIADAGELAVDAVGSVELDADFG